MNPGENQKDFRRLLDEEYSWPARYTFKFVVPSGKINEVKDLFDPKVAEISTRESSAGKYTSVTINADMSNADQIINIYEQASTIEGIISL